MLLISKKLKSNKIKSNGAVQIIKYIVKNYEKN